MTTDNRGSEPNKYAGFLARQNHQRAPWRGIGVKCLCGKVFDLDADHALHQVEEIMRAALTAAGVAPQEPSDDNLARASAWSDYRSEYGVHGAQSHRDFCAGWDAARGVLDIGRSQR